MTKDIFSNPVSQSGTQTILFVAVGSIIILLNSVEMFFILRVRGKLKIFEILLLNLATADLFVGIFVVVFQSLILVNKLSANGIVAGKIAFNCFSFFSVASSLFQVLLISLDRLVAVKFPIRHRTLITVRRVVKCEIVVWTITVLLALIISLQDTSSGEINTVYIKRVVTAVMILIGGVLFISFYTYIIHCVIKNRRRIQKNILVDLCKDKNCLSNVNQRDKAVTFICTVLIVSYLICVFPNAILNLLVLKDRRFDELSAQYKVVYFVTVLLLYLNSTLNPMTYFFRSYFEQTSARARRKQKEMIHELVETNHRDKLEPSM